MRWGVIQSPALPLDSVQSIKRLRSLLLKFFFCWKLWLFGRCVWPQSSYFYQDISGLFGVEGDDMWEGKPKQNAQVLLTKTQLFPHLYPLEMGLLVTCMIYLDFTKENLPGNHNLL